MIRWFAGLMGQTTLRPSGWCSKHYSFHNFLTLYLCKTIKKWIETILQEIKKTNNAWNIKAWSMSRSSQRPRELVYYIEDCRISNCKLVLENWLRIHLSYFLCSQPRLNKVKNLAILEVEIRGNWAMKRAISSNFSGYICKLHTVSPKKVVPRCGTQVSFTVVWNALKS